MKFISNLMTNLGRIQVLPCVKKRRIYSLLFIWAFAGLVGCSSEGNSEINPVQSKVVKKIYLRELTTAINIKDLKNIKYKKVNTNIYVFDYSYYGGVRNVQAEVNQFGDIHTLKFSLNENFDSLKLGIENKLEDENGKKITFECSSETITPNLFTTMHFKNCKVMSDSQILLLTEIDRERSESLQPRKTVNLELEDRNLKKKFLEYEKEAELKKEQERHNKKKSDI
jgi:hypothetical protein